jgi:hypothetical protein
VAIRSRLNTVHFWLLWGRPTITEDSGVDQVPVHCGARFSANARALLSGSA